MDRPYRNGRTILALEGGGVRNVVVDHCSTSWASDETISVAGPSRNVTVQRCLLAECLSRSVHQEGEHSKGSVLPRRDAIDARIIQSVREGAGAIIDSQAQVGGWPALERGEAPPDGDGDGMPDAWEKANGLDPGDPKDASRPGDDGYTQIERYINGLGARPTRP